MEAIQKALSKCNSTILAVFNFISFILIIACAVLRVFWKDEEKEGFSGVNPFLYFIQVGTTVLLTVFLALGELQKSELVLGAFPLLMSRAGRGVIMMMVALPLTQWSDGAIASAVIFVTLVALFNIMVGQGEPALQFDGGKITNGKPQAHENNAGGQQAQQPGNQGAGAQGPPRQI